MVKRVAVIATGIPNAVVLDGDESRRLLATVSGMLFVADAHGR
jgi:hypothetical protein